MDNHQRSARNTFADLSIDRCPERRDDLDWLSQKIRNSHSLAIHVHNGHCKLKKNQLALTPSQQFAPTKLNLLGQSQGQTLFSIRQEPCKNEHWIDIRTASTELDAFQSGLAAYAIALDHWQCRHQFCGRCGAQNILLSAGHRLKCNECNNLNFPRTDPAMIALITDGDSCLLGRQATWPLKRYSCLAGFVEPGESLEDCVRREVMEEAGVQLKSIHYHSSQPWPFPNGIMVAFNATALTSEIQLSDELEDARWWSIDDIQKAVINDQLLLPFKQSVSWRLLADWYIQKTNARLSSLNQK